MRIEFYEGLVMDDVEKPTVFNWTLQVKIYIDINLKVQNLI